MKLKDKVVVIPGAGSGIGKATVYLLVSKASEQVGSPTCSLAALFTPLNALPSLAYQGRVNRVFPQAEVVQNTVVFDVTRRRTDPQRGSAAARVTAPASEDGVPS